MPSPAHGGGLGRGLGGQRLLDLGEQAIEFDGLGVEIVAAGGERLLAIAGHLPPRVPTSLALRESPASTGADLVIFDDEDAARRARHPQFGLVR